MHLLKLAGDQKRPVPPNVIGGKGTQGITIISESGLYKLALRSDKKEAEAFQDWVTRDVLPAIRKDGGYILGEEATSSVRKRHSRWGEGGDREDLLFPLPC